MAKATSLADSLEKHLQCAVCLEQYTEPKVLPCLHSFCKRCLQGLLTQAGAVFKINCPTCRSSAEIPQGKIESLPVNFFVNNLLTMVALHEDSGIGNLECDNCESGDPPVNRCTTCSHLLCEFCTRGHRRGRNTSSHSLMSLEEVKKLGSVAITRPSLCKEHEGEVMKLFCETCEEAICRDCTIVKHHNHKYTFVKDAFSKGKENLLKILSETKTKVSVLEEAVDGVLKMKSDVHSSAEETVQEIVNCFKLLTTCLDTRRGQLIHKVEEFKKAKLKSLEIQQEELQTALTSVRSSVEFTEKAFENGSEVEILNMRKKMATRLQGLNSAKWQLEPCADKCLNFKNDGKLRHGIAAFGSVTDVETHAGMSTLTMENGKEGVMYNTLCGQPTEFTITAKDWSGRKQNEGGDDFRVFICDLADQISVGRVLDVRDCGNGRYFFCDTLAYEGHFKLSVKLKGCHIQGSPFHWCAERWNLDSLDVGECQLQLSEENLIAQNIKVEEAAMPGQQKFFGRIPNRPQYYPSLQDRPQYGSSMQDSYGIYVKPNDCKGPSGTSGEANLYAVGSVGLNNGKHTWKIQIDGKPLQGFSFGIMNTKRKGSWYGKRDPSKWVWNAKKKQYPLSGTQKASASNITDCASGDVIELYLDLEDEELRMYNPRTQQSDIWGGVKGEVKPVFHLPTDGDKVSLKIPQKA